MKNHVCRWPNCGKSFTRAEHLRRHALNHGEPRNGYTCERCSVHFHRPDLLARHMTRHAKRDDEAGGPGLGVLETRKRTRRADDGTIIIHPSRRQVKPSVRQSMSVSSVEEHNVQETTTPNHAPMSPPGSGSDTMSLSVGDTDPFLAPMMPGGPFEPYVEPIAGQFDAADGSFNVPMDGSGDLFSTDTATDFNMPFAATHNYNWLFDVASLDRAFDDFEFSFEYPTAPPAQIPNDETETQHTPPLEVEAQGLPEESQSASEAMAASLLDTLGMDWMSGGDFLGPTAPKPALLLSEDTRQRFLTLITKTSSVNIDGQAMGPNSPLLTLAALQDYLDLFFARFNTTYPLIHQPTFNPNTVDPVFLAAILSMGATYGTREAHQLAVVIHDNLLNQLLSHPDFSPQPDLWVLQSMLLIDCFGKMRAGPKQRERSQLFHCVLIKLIRRSDCCTIRSTSQIRPDNLEQDWRSAMDAEQRKRLAMHCFMWDTQHAVLFSQSLCMSAFEIRSSLPCGAMAWEATAAQQWASHAVREQEHLFLKVLKGYVAPGAVARPRDLNPFARIVILHGLMSVSSDLKRRDQTTLRSETPDRVGAWKPRVARSYDLWKVDFDADCLSMKISQTASPRQFTGLKTAAHALYRTASLALNVEILDLQIVAGASHILGRPVTVADQQRSHRTLPRWLHDDPEAAWESARHASSLLHDAVLSLHDWNQTDAFHFPWCLYLATITCWVFYRGINSPGTEERSTTDLASLIVMMTNCSSLTELASLSGKYDAAPLAKSMAEQLATVRWAVVHDAMKVLVKLST
ncbi:C2H2 finger domain transcription factor [Aspergillus avenaceus]|uniref:C2H2 finger domain transcription factor n=1 Tax=Aspergillus avenaceus TaxID=36643 RepID=A0A5N6U449_ASPAV|nr:C2H2 finger domain transcription factor [Aspergillus avenaceus]